MIHPDVLTTLRRIARALERIADDCERVRKEEQGNE
jgi:phosphate uptake regulator